MPGLDSWNFEGVRTRIPADFVDSEYKDKGWSPQTGPRPLNKAPLLRPWSNARVTGFDARLARHGLSDR